MEIVEAINLKDNVKEFIEENFLKSGKGSNTLQKQLV